MFVMATFTLNAQLAVVLDEGFESGIPAEWTQEQETGDFSWTVESGDLTRPSGAADGIKRVAFRNTTDQTRHYVTRLITPVMDLSDVYVPILCFSHAQDKWSGDYDVLKIYYRTSAEADWVLLKVYNECIPDWQNDTVTLVGVTETYQLAFEGEDNMGRGIVLDNIQVRSTPNCMQPYNLLASNISNNSATLSWNGSFDTETFHVKVSTEPLDESALNSSEHRADVVDTLISGEYDKLELKSLSVAADYYFYVKANCATESSFWSLEASFKTSNLVGVPYIEDFNLSAESGLERMDDWYYGTSTDEFCPFVNVTSQSWQRPPFSPDASLSLFFTGAKDKYGKLDGGFYAYAATPKIDVPLQSIQVSFVSIRQNDSPIVKSKIIVGAMTDPEDFGTFVPVDTVENIELRQFEEYYISFAHYKGIGGHVALVSDFSFPNAFILDDFRVTLRPDCPKAQFSYKLKSATELEILCKDVDNGCEVWLADTILDVNNIDMSRVKYQQTSASSVCTLSGLTPWRLYYVYVRMTNGDLKGEWSNYKEIRMPAKIDKLPYSIDFEINRQKPSTYYEPKNALDKLSAGVLTWTDGKFVPISGKRHVNTTYIPQLSAYELEMQVGEGGTAFAIFPENPFMDNSVVGFYSSAHSTYDHPARYYVGVMSDVRDTSTFVPLDTIEPELGYKRYVVDLSRYDGDGKFFAVKLPYIDEYRRNNYAYIDNLTFETKGNCEQPTNIEIQPFADKAIMTWSANGATEWRVLVLDRMLMYDSINNVSFENVLNGTYDIGLVFIDTVQTNSVVISSLFSGNKDYYVYLQPVCDGEVGAWTASEKFTTTCYEKEPLPYVMNFDNASDGTPYSASNWTDPWTIPCLWAHHDSYYYMQVVGNNSISGKNSIYFTYSVSYLVYPDMAVENINELQVSFWMKNSTYNEMIELGVMTDPTDKSTFELVSTIEPEAEKEYKEYIVPLANYNGAGRYIAMRPKAKMGMLGDINIDSVVIEPINKCLKVSKVRAEAITDSSATIAWNGFEETEWRLIVSKQTLTEQQLDTIEAVSDDIVFVNNVTACPYTFMGLESNCIYYVYVQALCTQNENGKWSSAGIFRTECASEDVGTLGVENFDTYGSGVGKVPTCYIVGNKASINQNFIPYCFYDYHHSGANSLKIYSDVNNNGAYAITPELDIDDIKLLRVHFYGSAGEYATDEYAHKLVVGVITSPSDLATFTPVDTLDFFRSEASYEVRFDRYIGDYDDNFGKYVMFFSEFDKRNIVFIDDVVFDTMPECVSPRIEVSGLTVDGCTIKFEGKQPYTVVVSSNLLREDQLEVVSVETIPGVSLFNSVDEALLLSNLQSGQDYYVYAKSDCGSESVWSSVKKFTTECHEKVSLPFFDDFDKNIFAGQHNNPRCWTSYYSVEGLETQYPCVEDEVSYSGKSVFVYASGEMQQSYMVSPYIDADLSKCQVSFFAKADNKNEISVRNIIVGIVDDISSIEKIRAFTPVDTIIINGGFLFSKYVIPFTDYSGEGKYVVFTNSYNDNHYNAGYPWGTNGGYYIDNVEVDLMPACYKPDNFSLEYAFDDELKISFGTLSDTQNFELEYGVSGFTQGTGKKETIDTSVVVLKGLSASTAYDVYLRSVCSSEEQSEWVLAGTYTTIVTPVSEFPFSCDFEDESVNAFWSLTRPVYRNKWYIGSAYPKDGTGSLYISGDNGNTAYYDNQSQSYAYAYIPVSLSEGAYNFAFDWTCFGESSYDFIRCGLIPLSYKFGTQDNNVVADDGQIYGLDAAKIPAGWIDLNENKRQVRFNGIDFANQSEEERWVHNTASVVVTQEEAGDYWLVFYWCNDGAGGNQTTPSAIIDNIVISKEECGAVADVHVNNVTDTSVELQWNVLGVTGVQYVVAIYDAAVDGIGCEGSEEHCAVIDTVSEMKFAIDTLTPGTRFYVYVQPLCGATVGVQSECVSFNTLCTASKAGLGITFDFENENDFYYKEYESGAQQTTYPIPGCFESWHTNLGYWMENAKTFPHIKVEESYGAYKYARSGKYSLYFFSNRESEIGGYIVLPKFEEQVKDLELTFWMRPISEYSGTVNSNLPVSQNRTRSITVGTMTNPFDASTFVPVQVVTYPLTDVDIKAYASLDDDPLGEKYWRQFTVQFTGKEGNYIAFRNDAVDGLVMTELYIDDIEIERISNCPIPNNIQVTEVTDSRISGRFNHSDGNKWVVKLAETVDMSDGVRIDTVLTPTFEFDELSPVTNYFITVSQLCGDENGQSQWSSPFEVSTLYRVRFTEELDRNLRVPDKWLRANSPQAHTMFNGSGVLGYQENNDENGWNREDVFAGSALLSSGCMAASVYGTYLSSWLISPSVHIPLQGNVHLTFDMALKMDTLGQGDIEDDDNKFMIIVSDDGGGTWKRENAIVWSNVEDDDFVFNDISSIGQSYVINLNKYAGKNIKVAFYVESQYSYFIKPKVYIDNVNINSYVAKPLTDNICQREDYRSRLFSISDTLLQVGSNRFEKIVYAADNAPDTIVTLDLTVTPVPETVIEDHVCEGTVYTQYDFVVDKAGVYRRKLRKSAGCDSIVTLRLTQEPIRRTTVRDTICQGAAYVFNGKEFKESGIYSETFVSHVTGCDSIVTLELVVNGIPVYEKRVTVCHGESYAFGKYGELAESGTYTDKFVSEAGCDSVVNLTLTVLPDLRSTIRATICAGEEYNGNGFSGITGQGEYTLPLKSEEGCDSTVTLVLTVLSGDTTRVSYKVSEDELPYEYESLYYGKDTKVGIYVDTINIVTETCDNVVIHTLEVTSGTGLNEVDYLQLVVSPNPVKVHQPITLTGSFSVTESLRVELFDPMGRILYSDTYSGTPITLPGVSQSGVYVIRITTRSGDTCQRKVVVQ